MDLLVLIALLAPVLVLSLIVESRSFKGGVGEKRVRSALQERLKAPDYQVLHDLTLPCAGRTTQIDHVVLSRHGIFVIETKNMSGWIFGDKEKARWTQVHKRSKRQFQNPLRQNYLHIKALQENLGVSTRDIVSVVAFVGSAEPKTPMPANVIWGSRRVPAFILAKQDLVFSDPEVCEFRDRLEAKRLDPSSHKPWTRARKERGRVPWGPAALENCPKCNESMLIRTSRKSGEEFLGCSRFPRCRGTRPMPAGESAHESRGRQSSRA